MERAAPAIRASCLKVFDVATTWSGAPKRAELAHRTGDLGAYVAAQGPDVVGVGRVAGQPARGQPAGAQRQRHGRVGFLVDAVGDLQRAAADVQDEQPAGRPAEPAPGGEEGEPGLVGAGEDLELDAGLGADPRARTSSPLAGLAHRGGGERQQILDALVLGGLERVPDDRDESVDPLGADRSVAVEEFGEAQLRPCASTRAAGARRGVRPPPADAPCSIPRRGHRVSCDGTLLRSRRPHPSPERCRTGSAAALPWTPCQRRIRRRHDKSPQRHRSSAKRPKPLEAARRSSKSAQAARREGARLRARVGRVP